jgi:hypothetical protein
METAQDERGCPSRSRAGGTWGLQLVAAVVILAAASCSGVNTYSTHTPPSSVNLQRVTRDPGLASDIEIEAIPPIDRGAGAKTAQITMRNLGGSTRTFEVQLDWFDEDGAVQTGSTVVWRKYTLGPGEVREASFTGGPKARDYRLSVRAQ